MQLLHLLSKIIQHIAQHRCCVMRRLGILTIECQRNRRQRLLNIPSHNIHHKRSKIILVTDNKRFLDRDHIAFLLFISLQVRLHAFLGKHNVLQVHILMKKQIIHKPHGEKECRTHERADDHDNGLDPIFLSSRRLPSITNRAADQISDRNHCIQDKNQQKYLLRSCHTTISSCISHCNPTSRNRFSTNCASFAFVFASSA